MPSKPARTQGAVHACMHSYCKYFRMHARPHVDLSEGGAVLRNKVLELADRPAKGAGVRQLPSVFSRDRA